MGRIVFTQISLLPNYLLLCNSYVMFAWMTSVFLKSQGVRSIPQFYKFLPHYMTICLVSYHKLTDSNLCMKYYLKVNYRTCDSRCLGRSSRLPYRMLASFHSLTQMKHSPKFTSKTYKSDNNQQLGFIKSKQTQKKFSLAC